MKRRFAILAASIAIAASILASVLAVSFLAKKPDVLKPSFEMPINLSESNTDAINQKMAVANNRNVYVAWIEDNGVGFDDRYAASAYDVFFRSSSDGGNTFAPKINLSNDTLAPQSPFVAAIGNHVYVAWMAFDRVENTYPLFFRSSDDNGNTFGDIIRLTTTGESVYNFDMAATSDSVYLAYASSIDDIAHKLRVSHDYGLSFAQPSVYFEHDCSGWGTGVETSVDGKNVYLRGGDSCAAEAGDEIVFRTSNDGGRSLGPLKRIDLGHNPQMAAAGNENVYITWSDRYGNVMLAASGDGGITINPPIVLADGKLISNPIPNIAATEKNVYVIWHANVVRSQAQSSGGLGNNTRETPINTVLFFRASTDNAASFEPVVRLTTLDEYAYWPGLDAVGSKVAIVWSNVSSTASEGSRIFYVDSGDHGVSFNSRIIVEGNTGDLLGFAKGEVALADHNEYVTWWRDIS